MPIAIKDNKTTDDFFSCLFDITENNDSKTITEFSVSEVKKTSSEKQKDTSGKPIKPVLPDILKKSEKVSSMYELLELFKVDYIRTTKRDFSYYGRNIDYYFWLLPNNRSQQVVYMDKTIKSNILFLKNFSNTRLLAFVDESMNVWTTSLNLKVTDASGNDFPYRIESAHTLDGITFEVTNKLKWKLSNKYPDWEQVSVINSTENLLEIINNYNKYLYEFVKTKLNNGYESKKTAFVYACCPQLETLEKAGFVFAVPRTISSSNIDKINRLCNFDHNNTNPKKVFKTSKDIYNTLKNESDLEVWDAYRKLNNSRVISKESIIQAYDYGFSAKDMASAAEILKAKYNDKPIFTWESLNNYLARLDQYEAIDRIEAFHLLTDYLRMCRQLNVEPKVDGDSLKREHDIMARNVLTIRNEKLSKELEKACSVNKEWDYEEDVFFVRHIKNYDDLIDEAKQQHNCVASYAQLIVKDKCRIFVMREKKHPEKSLITIELSPTGALRQKRLAYNQPIRNKAQSDFINRWLKFIKDIKGGI